MRLNVMYLNIGYRFVYEQKVDPGCFTFAGKCLLKCRPAGLIEEDQLPKIPVPDIGMIRW